LGHFLKSLVVRLTEMGLDFLELLKRIERDEVHMSVGDLFSYHFYAHPLRFQHVAYPVGYLFACSHHGDIIFVWYVPKVINLLFWDDKGVAGLVRVDVQESYRQFVFIDLIGWNLTFDDFGENAVGHFL